MNIQFRQRPSFPGSHPPSIVSAMELNFRVRYGNGCDLHAITTGYLSCSNTSQASFPQPFLSPCTSLRYSPLHPQNYTM